MSLFAVTNKELLVNKKALLAIYGEYTPHTRSPSATKKGTGRFHSEGAERTISYTMRDGTTHSQTSRMTKKEYNRITQRL